MQNVIFLRRDVNVIKAVEVDDAEEKKFEVHNMLEEEDASVDLMEHFNETHSSFEAAALLCRNQSDSFYIPGSRLSYSNGVIGNETRRGVIGSHFNSSYATSSLWDAEPLDLGSSNSFNAPRDDSRGHQVYCYTHYDGLLCWPRTLQGTTATLPCFPEFNGIPYDASRNATRYCHEGGEWDNRTDYSNCSPLSVQSIPSAEGNLEITTGVYFYGYCLSLIALMVALIIFLAFKELRCLRNTIHTHLVATYILADALWIITSSTTFTSTGQDSSQSLPGHSNRVSCVTFIMLHYFHLTNFFWMFVEGLYLYVLVVQTFVAENVKLRVYAFIGWGVPLIIVIGWSIAKWMTQSASFDIQATDPEFNVSTCLWLTVNIYDWIYKAPVILVLAANMLFLLQIMWVLITKLRSATNPETKQSRKAAKALLVLMPLLGITYVLILSGSKTPVYEHLRALLISTQGFLVAFLYCFVNHEVRLTIHHEWNRVRNMGIQFTCWDCHRRRRMQQMRQFNTSRSATHNTYLNSSPNQKLCHSVTVHMENNSIV